MQETRTPSAPILLVNPLIGAACLLMLTTAGSNAADTPRVSTSPDGRIHVALAVEDPIRTPTFSVALGEDTVAGDSPLGLKLDGANLDFTRDLRWTGSRERLIDERYMMPTGKRRERRNLCREVTHTFENEAGIPLSIIFRIFNDGVAFRYRTGNTEPSSVTHELSAFRFKDIARHWSIPFGSGDEGVFKGNDRLSEVEDAPRSFPVLIESTRGHWALATEADVSDYPLSSGLFEGNVLRYVFAREKEGRNRVPPAYRSPWRVLILGNQLRTIVESCMVDDLAPPGPIVIPDWIEPGVTSFPWWGENTANSHPEILKRYIDLSSAMNWRYVEFDVALVGSPARAVEDWKTTPWIGEVVDYAKARDVKCYGWDEFKNLNTAEKRADIFGRYKELGIAGCKVDFVNSYSQSTRRTVEELIRDAERYQMLLSFHGAQSPRGFARTYPHVMTFEAVRGSEHYLEINKATGLPPSHNCILPFTRNVLGSMDYTPVAFSSKLRTTTMAHELATAIVFESGWQGLCDVPEAYMESAARPLLSRLPAAWEETRLLAGYPGEFCYLARRKGNDWYVAGISATEAQTVSVDLSPILKGAKTVTLYQDRPGKEDEIVAQQVEIPESRQLKLQLKRHGGFAFVIEGT